MSHYAEMKAEILKNVDKEYLEKALNELGFTMDESDKEISDNYIGHVNVDAALYDKNTGEKTALGVIFNDGNGYAKIVGDTWNTGFGDAELEGEYSQQYARFMLEDQLELVMGYTVESVEMNEEGQIEIMAYCG